MSTINRAGSECGVGWAPIPKTSHDRQATPNLHNYEDVCQCFTWEQARTELQGLPDNGGLNIAHEAVTRHARSERREHVAIRWIGKTGDVREFSYGQLESLTNQFANVLRSLNVGAGDRVFSLAGRIPELYIAALGTLKNRSVFCPLFSAFGPEPIRARMSIGTPKVLVTTAALYRKKVAGIRESMPFLEHVLLVDADQSTAEIPGTDCLSERMASADNRFEIPPTDPEDLALLHFTSGTTGKAKGAMHVHQAVLSHHVTGKYALDLHPDDIFWCTADPGWVTGTSYGIISPLTNGVTSVVDEGDFDAARWYRILQDQKVNVWYTAPTAIRMLMKSGTELVREYDLRSLRFLASVGEPLNPEAVVWGQTAFGRPFHDNWWQSETGGIMIANLASEEVRPGSMGRPLPGVEAAIVEQMPDGTIQVVDTPDVEGELALRPGWPSMFRGYWNQPDRYQKCFVDGWYLSGDLAKRDRDGYFWFISRKDDVIKSSGHLIGPFEVESVLMEHKAVAEVGVIGKPDPAAFEVVKAFVLLKNNVVPSDELRRELMAFARTRLGAVVAPKEIEFVDSLPRTRSGKIMRRYLKSRELGLQPGDLSTLETAEPPADPGPQTSTP